MPLQYLKDNYDHITAVLIDIKDWEKITQRHKDINLMLEPSQEEAVKLNPSDYRGCISTETALKLTAHLTKSRNEWSSDI